MTKDEWEKFFWEIKETGANLNSFRTGTGNQSTNLKRVKHLIRVEGDVVPVSQHFYNSLWFASFLSE